MDKKNLDALFSWASKYNIDDKILPRDNETLQETTSLSLTSQAHVTLPAELMDLKKLEKL